VHKHRAIRSNGTHSQNSINSEHRYRTGKPSGNTLTLVCGRCSVRLSIRIILTIFVPIFRALQAQANAENVLQSSHEHFFPNSLSFSNCPATPLVSVQRHKVNHGSIQMRTSAASLHRNDPKFTSRHEFPSVARKPQRVQNKVKRFGIIRTTSGGKATVALYSSFFTYALCYECFFTYGETVTPTHRT
jgi:hypothetical protein